MVLDEKQVLARILMKHFQRIQKKNERFSLRAFAKKLEISSAALSEILALKRSTSVAKARSLVSKLPLSPADRKLIEDAFSNSRSLEKLKPKSNSRTEVIMTESEFDLMSDWRYFAMMALTRTSDFKSDPVWIASRLGIKKSEAISVIERLLSLKILKRDARGSLSDNNATYRTPSDFPDGLIRSRQLNGILEVAEQLKTKTQNQAGFFSTITTDVSKLGEAELMIEDFLKRLSLFLCDGEDRTEVFELQVQLFPRSKR